MEKIYILLTLLIFTNPIGYSQKNPEEVTSGCHDIEANVNSCPNNPIQKSGWNLILNENFQYSGRDKHWNKSICGDDQWCSYDFGNNQNNVTFESPSQQETDGNSLPNPEYIAKIWNTNLPSTCPDCQYSKGEMKTMSILNEMFKSYYFYGPGYIEAKIKMYAKEGQGAAMWLWSVQDPDVPYINQNRQWDNQEIDVFETQSGSDNEYNATYHWRTHDLTERMESHKVILNNHNFTEWTVFGIEWNDQMIQWSVNNTVVHTLYMSESPAPSCGMPGILYDPPKAPFCLRFNSGANAVGVHPPANPNELPQYMQIAYVRIYQQAGSKTSPIHIWNNNYQICYNESSPLISDHIITANYYPDATYQWYSPSFDITPHKISTYNHQHYNKYKVSCKEGVIAGWAPITLTINFPWGYVEQNTIWMKIIDGVPTMPGSIFNPILQPFNCRFYLGHPISDPTVLSAYWSSPSPPHQKYAELVFDENGTPTESILYGNWEPNQYIQITYQDFNVCGGSPLRTTSVYIPQLPNMPCQW